MSDNFEVYSFDIIFFRLKVLHKYIEIKKKNNICDFQESKNSVEFTSLSESLFANQTWMAHFQRMKNIFF